MGTAHVIVFAVCLTIMGWFLSRPKDDNQEIVKDALTAFFAVLCIILIYGILIYIYRLKNGW